MFHHRIVDATQLWLCRFVQREMENENTVNLITPTNSFRASEQASESWEDSVPPGRKKKKAATSFSFCLFWWMNDSSRVTTLAHQSVVRCQRHQTTSYFFCHRIWKVRYVSSNGAGQPSPEKFGATQQLNAPLLAENGEDPLPSSPGTSVSCCCCSGVLLQEYYAFICFSMSNWSCCLCRAPGRLSCPLLWALKLSGWQWEVQAQFTYIHTHTHTEETEGPWPLHFKHSHWWEITEPVQVHYFTLRSRDRRSKRMKMDVKSTYMGSYVASNGSCFVVTWTIFKNRLLQRWRYSSFNSMVSKYSSWMFEKLRKEIHIQIELPSSYCYIVRAHIVEWCYEVDYGTPSHEDYSHRPKTRRQWHSEISQSLVYCILSCVRTPHE
jgi:hypothetical protein